MVSSDFVSKKSSRVKSSLLFRYASSHAMAGAPCPHLDRSNSSTDPYVKSATPTKSASPQGEKETPAVSPKWSNVCFLVNPELTS